MNVELIEKEFDDKELSNRTGSYGKLLTYITYAAYVRRMNEVFEYEWSCEVTQLDYQEDEVIAVVKVTAESVSKTQAGGKRITRNKEGKTISLGDDVKAAISTAFKKACQMFGIGLYLADGESDADTSSSQPQTTTSRTNGTITQAQIGLIKKVRTEMGMSREDVQSLCEEMFKTQAISSLNKTQASTFINALKVVKQTSGTGAPSAETSV